MIAYREAAGCTLSLPKQIYKILELECSYLIPIFARYFYFMRFDEYRIADGIKESIDKLGYKKPTDKPFCGDYNVDPGEECDW